MTFPPFAINYCCPHMIARALTFKGMQQQEAGYSCLVFCVLWSRIEEETLYIGNR